MSANDRQEFGDHYQADFQHWDLIERYGVGYLEGCATKYITRHRKKNGIQDLIKAKHYTEKLLEMAHSHNRRARGYVGMRTLKPFFLANNIADAGEITAIVVLCSNWDRSQLSVVINLLDELIEECYPDGE